LLNNTLYFVKKDAYSKQFLKNENGKTLFHFYNNVTQRHHQFQLMNNSDTIGALWVSDTLVYTYNDRPANLWFQSNYVAHFDSIEIMGNQYLNVKQIKYYIGINVDDVPSDVTLCSDFYDLYVAEDIGPIYWEIDKCVDFNTYASSSVYTLNDYLLK